MLTLICLITSKYVVASLVYSVISSVYDVICMKRLIGSRINGIPACANKKLLTDITRQKWGFHGYVISDEEAVENLVLYHHYANSSMEAMIDVIEAGLNLELTTSRKNPYFFTMSTRSSMIRV